TATAAARPAAAPAPPAGTAADAAAIGALYGAAHPTGRGTGDELRWRRAGKREDYFAAAWATVLATERIWSPIAVRIFSNSRSFSASFSHDATVRSVVSVTIGHSGLAGSRAVSAKRRTWSVVISLRLRLPPKVRASSSRVM